MMIWLTTVGGHKIMVNPSWIITVAPHHRNEDVRVVSTGEGAECYVECRETMLEIEEQILSAAAMARAR